MKSRPIRKLQVNENDPVCGAGHLAAWQAGSLRVPELYPGTRPSFLFYIWLLFSLLLLTYTHCPCLCDNVKHIPNLDAQWGGELETQLAWQERPRMMVTQGLWPGISVKVWESLFKQTLTNENQREGCSVHWVRRQKTPQQTMCLEVIGTHKGKASKFLFPVLTLRRRDAGVAQP